MYLTNKAGTLKQIDSLGNTITLHSGIDVGQGINVGPGTFGKKNKRRAFNKHRA